MAPRVLISDKLSDAAVKIFAERGVKADVKTGLSKQELISIIGYPEKRAIIEAIARAMLEHVLRYYDKGHGAASGRHRGQNGWMPLVICTADDYSRS